MKAFNSTVTIPVYPYNSNRPPKMVEVAGRQVGDLIAHRDVFWFAHEPEARQSERYWQLTHVPSKTKLSFGMPERIRSATTRKVLLDFAEAFQRAAPEFFAAARDGKPVDPELARVALDIANSL
jgi:hypothetical protein